MPLGQVRVGCSGWQYAHWRARFYPAELPARAWLDFYARAFDTVELNASFYRLPERDHARAWRAGVPDGFLFAWKASRFLTHMKKLKDPDEPLRRMFHAAEGLGDKLGPVLYQLPPRWPKNAERLEELLAKLPRRHLHVVEMREPSWYDDDVLEALARANVALCLHDMPGSAPPRMKVGPFLYLRFHGADGRYKGGYPDAALRSWARWLVPHVMAGTDVYAYFNNDVGAHAPRDAARFRAIVRRAVSNAKVIPYWQNALAGNPR